MTAPENREGVGVGVRMEAGRSSREAAGVLSTSSGQGATVHLLSGDQPDH